MAIVDMSRFNLFCFEEDRKDLLDELQRFEYVHFSDTSERAAKENLETVEVTKALEVNEDRLAKVQWMLDLLEPREEGKSAIQSMKDGLAWFTLDELKDRGSAIDGQAIYQDIKSNTDEIEDLQDQIKAKESVIDVIKARTYTSDTVRTIFGIIQDKYRDSLLALETSFDEVYIEFLEEDNKNLLFYAIVSKEDYQAVMDELEEMSYQPYSEPGKYLYPEEIAEVEGEIKQIEDKIAQVEKRIDGQTKYIDELEILYEYLSNENLRLKRIERFMGIDEIDIISGYVPSEQLDDFNRSVESILGDTYYLEAEAADKQDDSVPVLLDNNSVIEPFESITLTYSRPKYSEMDPTPFLSIFYWVFFGMMVADLGYGLVLTILTGIALAAFNLSDSTRSTVKFFFYMGISTIIWGILYGSFFGYDMPFHVIDSGDYGGLLVLSIGLGAIHLFAGLALQAYLYIREGKIMDAVYDVLLWYMALIGAALLLLGVVGVVGPTPQRIGTIIMIIGMVGIVLFGGRSADSIATRLALGAYELYGISSWLGDFVSYSRLMALGLSGGFIAFAINLIIDMLPNNIIGIIAGVIIFLGGHAFNIFLSNLSAYVHDMRLTYVEFFGKFYEGGGAKFEKFVNEDTKYINIKENK